jgi:hypothetical protein
MEEFSGEGGHFDRWAGLVIRYGKDAGDGRQQPCEDVSGQVVDLDPADGAATTLRDAELSGSDRLLNATTGAIDGGGAKDQ